MKTIYLKKKRNDLKADADGREAAQVPPLVGRGRVPYWAWDCWRETKTIKSKEKVMVKEKESRRRRGEEERRRWWWGVLAARGSGNHTRVVLRTWLLSLPFSFYDRLSTHFSWELARSNRSDLITTRAGSVWAVGRMILGSTSLPLEIEPDLPILGRGCHLTYFIFAFNTNTIIII